MDTKINYTLVGFFVFSFGLLLVLFLLWMAKYGFEEKKFDSYTIIVADSVAGLNIESPVKYRGVEVGNVSAISIDPNNSEVIKVSIEVKPKTPIKYDSIAVLTAQGITGLSYIELKGGSKESKRLPQGGTITAGKSLFDKLESSATSVSESITYTLSRVDNLLNNKNIEKIDKLLNKFDQLINNLNNIVINSVPLVLNQENADNIKTGLASMAKTSQTLEKESKNIGKVINMTIELEKSAKQSLNDYSLLSNKLSLLLTSIQKRFESGEFDLRQMTEHHLETLNALLVELQMLTKQTNETLQQLKRSPSDLLFKQEIIKAGPGEE